MDRRSAPWLFALWALATALNVAKPYHVDDAYYLAQARWIAEHPMEPTSGLVLWEGDAPATFHEQGNHPFLVPALMALVIRAVGESSIALHLLTSVFSALAIALMHTLARRHAPERAVVITALFALGPAFLAEQNVMLDVPLVAAWLAFFVVLDDVSRPEHLVRAGVVASLALMIKLVSVALLLVLALEAARAIRTRMLPGRAAAVAFVAPALTLAAWCAWSVAEHGELPLVARLEASEQGPLGSLASTLGRAALWPIVIGGITPLLVSVAASRLTVRDTRRPVLVAITATLALFVVGRALVLPLAARLELEALAHEPAQHTLLRAVFLVGGVALAGLVLRRVQDGHAVDARLARWAVIGSVTVVALAPFVAARHGLLIAPALLLLIARAGWLDRHAGHAVALTAALGVLASVADHRMAAVYEAGAGRLAARAIERGPAGARTYFVGHWGWQEHASSAGLAPYLPGHTSLRPGDLVVVPDGVHGQRITTEDLGRLETVELDVVPSGPLDVVRTVVDREGLYVSWLGLPWTLRDEPLERFRLLRVRPGP